MKTIVVTGGNKGIGLEICRQLSERGHNEPIAYPDISTKEKAQKFIGLDMEKLKEEKKIFKKNVLPEWKRKAKERQDSWIVERY